MSELQLQVLCRGDDGFRLDIDCHLPLAGVTAIYGPSGSGKTTLLNTVAGILPADTGSTITFGQHRWQAGTWVTPPWERNIGFVFQDGRLFPHLSVQQNLEFGLQRRGGNSQLALDEVVNYLQLHQLLPRHPESLSAGQKQRVAIGRALLGNPHLLLMDEPLANLDHAARGECLYYLRRLRHSLNIPIVYVSHDIEEISQLADHLVLLENGKITAQGPLIELCSRLDTRLSHEEQAAAIVSGVIGQHDQEFDLSEITVEGQVLFVSHIDGSAGQQQRLRIPARDVSICRSRPTDSSILNIIPVTVAEVEATSGSRVLLRLALGEQFLLARITRKSADRLNLAIGDRVFAQIKSAALLSQALPEAPP